MFDREHMLFQWTGGFLAGPNGARYIEEIWVGSMRFATDDGGPQIALVDNDNAHDDLVSDLGAFMRNVNSAIPARCVLLQTKWNRIGRDGRYVNDQTRVKDHAWESYTGSIPSVYPMQVSWATTWTTDATRGLAKAGRTFWPTAMQLTDGDYGFKPDQTLAMARMAQKLIDDWGNWDGFDTTTVRPYVMSRKGEGMSRPITGVKVGDRLDIQRRRKGQKPEKYSQAYPGPGQG